RFRARRKVSSRLAPGRRSAPGSRVCGGTDRRWSIARLVAKGRSLQAPPPQYGALRHSRRSNAPRESYAAPKDLRSPDVRACRILPYNLVTSVRNALSLPVGNRVAAAPLADTPVGLLVSASRMSGRPG